jgi:DNA-binding SARP family transcriptional activator
MICFARLGQRERAIGHYQRCRQVLKAELGVEPAPETERLYRELMATGGINNQGSSLRR